MGVSVFGGADGPHRGVSPLQKTVTDQPYERLLTRVQELERLCTDLLVAGVDLGLPQHLLNRLWGAVGHGELPHAFMVDLPPAPPKASPATGAGEVEPASVLARASGAPEAPAVLATVAAPAPMPIPDIPLTTNPLLPRDDSRPTPPQAHLKPLAVRKTVVVVDDDPMMLDVLSRILQRENFELLLARGGPEMIGKLSDYDGQVDLLVTDYAMPDMQGCELADRVRQRFPAVKVLYQTGFSDMLFENRIELEEGAAFLEKPFTARGLREAARLVLFGSINP